MFRQKDCVSLRGVEPLKRDVDLLSVADGGEL